MPTQQLRLALREARPQTPTVTTFRFDLGDRTLDYRPGQYSSVKLDGVEDPRGPMRPFTLSSSPTEPRALAITTRLTGSPFKTRLAALRPGEEVDIRAPMGDFTLDTGRPAVMIAGGIGITPFRSMIRFAADRGLELPIVLLYSCRTPSEIVFKPELNEVVRNHRNVRVVYTITRPEESKNGWKGRRGHFDAATISAEGSGLERAVYYVCGSARMVDGMTKLLAEEVGVEGEDIRAEDFPGY